MHRIIRTALASMGAAVVVAGGSLGVAYATAPTPDPAPATSSADSDQVAALDKQADDLLATIATLEKQLASLPSPTASPSQLTKQELVVTTDQNTYVTPQSTKAAAQAAAPAAPAASSTTKSDESDPKNGSDTDD